MIAHLSDQSGTRTNELVDGGVAQVPHVMKNGKYVIFFLLLAEQRKLEG